MVLTTMMMALTVTYAADGGADGPTDVYHTHDTMPAGPLSRPPALSARARAGSYQAGEFFSAHSHLTAALELRPAHADYLEFMGVLLHETGARRPKAPSFLFRPSASASCFNLSAFHT